MAHNCDSFSYNNDLISQVLLAAATWYLQGKSVRGNGNYTVIHFNAFALQADNGADNWISPSCIGIHGGLGNLYRLHAEHKSAMVALAS